MLVEIAIDCGLQIDDRAEDASLETTPCERREECFGGVQPRTGCRREVEDPIWMSSEPLADLFVLMGGVVIENDVDHLAGRHGALDSVEETDELLMPVSLHASAEHGAIENVERSEQCGRAMPHIVMSHRPGFPMFELQARLGPIQVLDLGLLVVRQGKGMSGRRDVEDDDVPELGDELGIIGSLEGTKTMRLEIVGLPDPLNGTQRHAHDSSHGPARCRNGPGPNHLLSVRLLPIATSSPVCGLTRRFTAGERNDLLNDIGGDRRLAGFARRTKEQALPLALVGEFHDRWRRWLAARRRDLAAGQVADLSRSRR